MIVTNTEFEFSEDEPFKNDKLGRQEIGEKLTLFLKKTEEPLVLSIDAEWGQGKTTFLKMWRNMLKKEGFTTLYYSAWENDYNNDALVSIIGELEEEISKVVGDGSKKMKLQENLNNIKDYGSDVLKNSLPFLLKILTSGLIDANNIGDEIGELAKDFSKRQIEEYKNSKNKVVEFKKSLSELAKNLNAAGENRPLVIMVDELDRCRPDFALQVLERIKHFFLTPNIIFVLAIDRHQLVESIKTVYGANLNTSGYLKRFIDIEFSLPNPSIHEYSKVLYSRTKLDELIRNHKIDVNRTDLNEIQRKIQSLIFYFDCTLREAEKCYSKLSFTIKITNRDNSLFPDETTFLILLSIKYQTLYKKFITKKITVDQLFEELSEKSNKLLDFVHSVSGIKIWALLFSSFESMFDCDEKLKALSDQIKSDSLSDKKLELLSHRKKHLQNEGSAYIGRNVSEYILKNIELSSKFNQ